MRHNEDWIEAFVRYTDGIKSPECFRRWSAISAISGAMQRCNYTIISKQILYGNLYILLIGYPGKGKSNAVKHARNILARVDGIRTTPTRITSRAFYNQLEDSISDPVIGNSAFEEGYRHSSMTGMLDEFSVFVRPRASEFMADLADVYDCPKLFSYKTATQGEVSAECVYINIIGGATPAYLKDAWSSTVLDEGFPARCIIVYSDEEVSVPLFGAEEDMMERRKPIEDRLVADLGDISHTQGRFTWAPDASKAFEGWHEDGMPPRPEDVRLSHYCERRVVHIAKLCMIHSAARRDDLEVSMEDFESAKATLLAAETSMIGAIEPMGASPQRDAMMLARRFVAAYVEKKGRGCPENQLRNVLVNEIDPTKVNRVIEEMVLAKWLRYEGEQPSRKFSIAIELPEED